jgi:hypothetical protein
MNFFTKTHLQVSTYSAYNNKLNKWISLMPENKNNLRFMYTNPNFSVVTLRKTLLNSNKDTATTLNSYIKAIMSAAEHNLSEFNNVSQEKYSKSTERWKELRQKTYEYANGYRFEQKPSPTQMLKTGSKLKMNDLIKMRDALHDTSIDKLLLGFYTYVPPVRSDFFATEIIPFNATPSYPNFIFYSPDKSYLKLTHFKTSDYYKSIEYELPVELHRLLSVSLTNNPRKFLFQNKSGQPFNHKSFSVWAANRLSILFKKQFTITLFRHIFISNLDPNTPAETLIEISKKMGHSITQQMLYRWTTTPDS